MPAELPRRLVHGLSRCGVTRLYAHQRAAYDALKRGRDVVVATPTASGKTLCYNLPVFEALASDPTARALYLFPTKALARDQVEAARSLGCAADLDVGVAVYDGDTPVDQRRAARRHARIVATNPDMLHTGILPHHTGWAELFAGLRYVVIDELHVYRGVFGSNVANVLRRLQRIARFYGADPQFICCSATIANPAELAQLVTGRAAALIDKSGAPQSDRHVLLFNPPLVDAALGLRQSYLEATCTLVDDLQAAGLGTLVFCRSRLAVEVVLRQLRERQLQRTTDGTNSASPNIRGYRGGYLPERRREVEHEMRQGKAAVVVATSALELGIDIGSIDAVVLAGWPGSRAAVWQRAGRAGRHLTPSIVALVTSSRSLDQYVAQEPDYLFSQSVEHARLDAENPSILVPHIKCGAYELPLTSTEAFGALDRQSTRDVLECLAEANILHRSTQRYHYVSDVSPANDVSLRGRADENFLVVDQPNGRIIAEVDYDSAVCELHDHAIYQLEGQQYEVERLDHDHRKAYVRPVQVDYYTDALTQTKVRVLECSAVADSTSHGEVHVVERVVGFKKLKLHSHENVGYGDVEQLDREKHTTAIWFNVSLHIVNTLRRTPAELVESCLGLGRALHTAAALLLMSDSADIGQALGDARANWFPVVGRSSPRAHRSADSTLGDTFLPTIFLFDRYPGGTGLSSRLFEQRHELLRRSVGLIQRCACHHGCPACVGPGGRTERKSTAQAIGKFLLEGASS